jgi:GT2 family glycosyltransferase
LGDGVPSIDTGVPSGELADEARLLSVIVCTRLRPESVRRCLASLQSLNDPNYEVVVVDNAHVPSLGELVGGHVRVVHEPRIGLCFARNRGVEEVRGELIAFIDDDCEADPNWIQGLRIAFHDAAVSAVTGRALPVSLTRPSHRWFEHFSSFDRGPNPNRFVYKTTPPEFCSAAAALGSGCNMAFRRDVFDRVGIFDTVFDHGLTRGGGDIDFLGRVLEAGEVVQYASCAVIRHHHRDTMRALCWQLFGYGIGIGALSLKSLLAEGRLTSVLGFHRRWSMGMMRMIRRRRRWARPVGVFLMCVLFAGELCAPIPFVWHHVTARWARR